MGDYPAPFMSAWYASKCWTIRSLFSGPVSSAMSALPRARALGVGRAITAVGVTYTFIFIVWHACVDWTLIAPAPYSSLIVVNWR